MAEQCSICKNKIGFGMEKYTLEDVVDGYVCYFCNEAYMNRISTKIASIEEYKKQVEDFERYLVEKNISGEIKTQIKNAIEQVDESVRDQIGRKETTVQKYQTLQKNLGMITTSNSFEGYIIKEYKGIVSGDIVIGTGAISELEAKFSDTLGKKSSAFSGKMAHVKRMAQEEMMLNAAKKGANAIIAVQFEYVTFTRNMLGISANGTAVLVEKK